ncbi:hypothetical protein LLEC1_04693 [Akanthomyces lecanii]|uniref:Peptidase S1 domain-containing protein n=1 Tax=Cordyceps confragosa TaxID=2714763 RepID=A0A179I882_CORDF|nr:hypothetical protein LLEC1_04693 [Akanthomyces lecanii]
MELTKFLAFLAVVLPVAYGAPTQPTNDLHPQILEAMKRDLGLDAEQATARVARDLQASNVIEQVRSSVGDAFAGAWIDADVVHIGVTDQASAEQVTSAGARPVVVSNSLSKLEKAKADLDNIFVGGQANARHGAALGTFSASVFPGSADMSYVRTVSGTTLRGYINGYGQGSLPVKGSTESAVGASICRSGSTTQVHCGTVRAKGATVNYAEGSVTGLTQTSVCAEPGDSGGSFYSGTQAQGVTSGGSGNCQSGGTTFFQPVNEILQTYRLTLVTA